jgi:hypothetical protein
MLNVQTFNPRTGALNSVTTMQMLVSSSPPHEAAKQVALVEILLEFGAAPDGVEDNGSPIMTALRFHYPQAAEALARGGAARRQRNGRRRAGARGHRRPADRRRRHTAYSTHRQRPVAAPVE